MKTIEEKNRIIAEFMGVEFTKIGERFMASPTPNEVGSCWEEQLKYHTSWDWLMPVVEKIESVRNEDGYHLIVCIEGTVCKIQNEDGSIIVDADDVSKMAAIYKAVVQFIEWYNNQG